VKLALEALPTTLDDTYTRMLLGIEEMYHQQALTLLQWLAYARSPPTLGELVEAAIIDPIEEISIDMESRGDIEDTLNILAGLVATQESQAPDDQGGLETELSVVDVSSVESGCTNITHYRRFLSSKTRVRLAHFSVKEYLESKRMLQGEANHFYLESAVGHRILAQSCLTYLQHYSASSDKTLTEQDLALFPLVEYSAQSWYYHATLQSDGEVNREVSFLLSDGAREAWLHVHNPDNFWKEPSKTLVHEPSPALYYASLLGLGAVVKTLVDRGADVNAQGGENANALQAASLGGHKEVVQLLLNKDADVNAQGGRYGNALRAASTEGHQEVVQLLLEKGADVNAQDRDHGNALEAASFRGFENIVRLLLDKGAIIEAEGVRRGSLSSACIGGHIGLVRLLLDEGACINAQGNNFGNSLQAASLGGHAELVQFLLDKGADVHDQGGHYGNALQAAASEGFPEVVQLLLDNGAVANAPSRNQTSALQAASFRGYSKIVQLLLNNDADVNAQGGCYGTALQAASVKGHKEVVQLLQAAGAQDLSVDNDCRAESNN
jgi:ankyrin repeat protein